MPRILINEIDNTSPGAPSDYSNYAVLIAGFEKTNFYKTDGNDITSEDTNAKNAMNAERAKAIDSNGVYEFSSASKFKNVIGLVAPNIEEPVDASGTYKQVIHHYGNQMAYELLNLGYKVIYKVIDADNINKLGEADFWEVFKDKANYDFRFVTHGLLESSNESNNIYLKNIQDREKTLETIKSAVEASKSNDDTAAAFDELQVMYDTDLADYENADAAIAGLAAEMTSLTSYKEKIIGVTGTLINNANTQIAKLASYEENSTDADELPGRGDCIALVEIDEETYVKSNSTQKPEILIIDALKETSSALNSAGKFCAITVPSVCYKMTDNTDFGNNKKFPGAFHYLACFANSLNKGFAEWYAAAGYTRGVSSYVIDYTTVKLGEIAINALEPRNAVAGGPTISCNVIANFRGSYYLWGNRTACKLNDANASDGDLVASHFLNIRHLCATIKKQLYVACRRFTFDPNSDVLWFNFVNAIRPTLEEMKADQGIKDYRILKVVENDPKKATLKARIRIIPIEAVEDFNLEISLEDSFGETAVNAVESI